MTAPSPRSDDARGWRLWLIGFWAVACAWLLWRDWPAIAAMAMPDSDDDMRLLQLRDWLTGQGWFDLRQYRLDPPAGADIHWTRLVDLPLAAIVLPLRPFLGMARAEHVAAVVVPLLTLLCAMALLASITRRTVAPAAWWWAPLLLLMASPALGMMVPLRVDHHGWQIVSLLAMLWGLTDGNRARGGWIAGTALAASLAIGVEMLPYLALGLGAAALGWVADAREGARLRRMAAAAAIGAAAAWVLLIPPAARFGARCDALSIAYLAPLTLGAAGLVTVSFARAATWKARLALIAGTGMVACLALIGPGGGCLADPYRAIDPEARRLWLAVVAEALPLFAQTPEVALAALMLPLIGLTGALVMVRRTWHDPSTMRAWALLLLVSFASIALCLTQTRANVTAQVIAVPGAAALAFLARGRLKASGSPLIRVFGSVLLFLCVSGLLPRIAIAVTLGEPPSAREEADAKATAACMAPAALARLDSLPPGTVLATLDAMPALVMHSHHRAIAGPYHRNGRVIVAVMHIWTGSADAAHAMMDRYRVTYVAQCGAPSEGALYLKRNPHGFYGAVRRGAVPPWLAPVPVAGTPWRIWRVVRQPPLAHRLTPA